MDYAERRLAEWGAWRRDDIRGLYNCPLARMMRGELGEHHSASHRLPPIRSMPCAELARETESAIRQLEDLQLRIIVRRYFDGLRPNDVAEDCGISRRSYYRLLSIAKSRVLILIEKPLHLVVAKSRGTHYAICS